ncbi:MAG: hypothetical protein AAGG01_06475 [Planctomycetota bacterium]
MHPQPPSNEDGYFGRPESEHDSFEGALDPEADENSWLLDDEDSPEDVPVGEHEAVQALPGEFGQADGLAYGPDDAATTAEEAARIDELLEGYAEPAQPEETLGASFVEPESASSALSRALVPAGAALLISFSGIAVWAFIKDKGSKVDPSTIQVAAPDPVQNLDGGGEELVVPVVADSGAGSGRISFQRDGSQKVIGGAKRTAKDDRKATVKAPREPGELPPAVKPSPMASIESPKPLVSKAPVAPPAGDSDEDQRPSFTNFGAGLAAATTPEKLEVQEDDGSTSFDSVIDHEVADEVLDAFATLEDDLFLPQSFLDSVVLSIDPIDNVVSIYGDLNSYEEQDSFAEMGFDRTQPFTAQGFNNFQLTEWEDNSFDSALAAAEDAPAYDVDVPFGMFTESFMGSVDDTLASVDVAVEPTTVEISAEVTVPSQEQAQEQPEGVVSEVAIEVSSEAAEGATGELVAEAEVKVEEPSEVTLGDLTYEETVGDEAGLGAAVVLPGAETSELPIADEAPVAAAELPIEESPVATSETEQVAVAEAQPDLDLDAANARLDAMFGPVAGPDALPEKDSALAQEFELEVEAVEIAEVLDVEEPLQDTLLEDLAGWALTTTPVPAPPLSETPSNVPTEMPSEAPMEVAELEGPVQEEEVALEPTAVEEVVLPEMTETVAVAELPSEAAETVPELPTAPETPAAEPASKPAPEAATQPESVEVLASIADETAAGRRRSALRRVDDDGVWQNRTVPKSKLRGDQFVLTPNVGNVRVIFDAGETVDGRLHGVGDERIVLDTKLGRMTLDARRATRIDRLGGGSRKELRSPSESFASTKGLDRVKVRAAGGVFYGHLVAQTETKVTLLLDGGVRVTLDSTEVETSKARRATSRLRRN